MVVLPFPVVDNDELAKIVHIQDARGWRGDRRGQGPLRRARWRGRALERRLDEICAEVDRAIADGVQFVVLSDRDSTADLAPIPSLLLTGGVHHHLIRTRTRTRVGLLVEAG